MANGDFLSLDFLGLDFFTGGNIAKVSNIFKARLFEYLPYYFLKEDTYKDGNGQGLLERYLAIFGGYIDDFIIPDIENYLNIIDATIMPSKYIETLSGSLGNPPDIFQTDKEYRNLLQYIVTIYKIKGTKEAYELFFNILGYNTVLTEIPLVSNQVLVEFGDRYDGGTATIYDSGNALFTYDQNIVEYCSEYDLTLTPKSGTIALTPSLQSRINEAIRFNEPINAVLRTLIVNEVAI